MRIRFALPFVAAFAGCGPVDNSGTPTRGTIANTALPPMKTFAASKPGGTNRSNADLARDFLDLTFYLESGRALDRLTKFEGPISLRVTGRPPASLGPDLKRLLSRLRNEAQIDIRQTNSPNANITIEATSRAAIHRVLPQAACFVAPNVSSIDEYRKLRRSAATNWALLETRQRMAIFVPNDVSPQELRDCLHEELAQALGPLNDLYRLHDSVFNDDNVHAVLTGFDMLILRAYYDPALRSGMSRGQVAAALPAVLNRINPRGAGGVAYQSSKTPDEWNTAIKTALGRSVPFAKRQSSASKALRIATSMGWTDNRRAFAHYAMGRVLQTHNPAAAREHYRVADRFYAQLPNTMLHRAYVATQLGAHAINGGDATTALQQITPYLSAARRHENAALLSTLLMLQAEALELSNRPAEARSVRLDSIGWARYGFGADGAVRAKMREIASLNPQKH